MSIITTLLGLGGKVVSTIGDKISPDRSAARQQQSDINREEVAGAPHSRLRLWRAFLGWALSLAFVWEACFRPVILHYAPDANLPPSMIKEISSLLLGMLGLGF